MVFGRSISRVEIGHKASTAGNINSTRSDLLQRRWRTETSLPIPKCEGYKNGLFENRSKARFILALASTCISD